MPSRSRRRYRGASRSAKASSICWEVQAAVGSSVTLKCNTWRRRCSNTMNTNSTFMVTVGTVKQSIDTNWPRHGEAIDRHQLAKVVVKKRLPGLSRWPAEGSQNSGDGTLGHRD